MQCKLYEVQKCAIKCRVYKVHNIRYSLIYKFPAIKYDKIQYMLMRQIRGDGGEKVNGDVEDSTGQKM